MAFLTQERYFLRTVDRMKKSEEESIISEWKRTPAPNQRSFDTEALLRLFFVATLIGAAMVSAALWLVLRANVTEAKAVIIAAVVQGLCAIIAGYIQRGTK
jgi:hypothetical protein